MISHTNIEMWLHYGVVSLESVFFYNVLHKYISVE